MWRYSVNGHWEGKGESAWVGGWGMMAIEEEKEEDDSSVGLHW